MMVLSAKSETDQQFPETRGKIIEIINNLHNFTNLTTAFSKSL
jgi:hypothetical protein